MGYISTEDNQKVTWHLGMDWNREIMQNIQTALSAFLGGNKKTWYYHLKAVRFLIISYLNEKERQTVKQLESEINKSFVENNDAMAAKKIEEYDIYIKDLLCDKGFLNPFKDDETKLFR